MTEPVQQLLSRVESAWDTDDPETTLSDVVFQDSMLAGLENAEAVTKTVVQWLLDIVKDERDHCEVAGDLDHDSRNLHPLPWLVIRRHCLPLPSPCLIFVFR